MSISSPKAASTELLEVSKKLAPSWTQARFRVTKGEGQSLGDVLPLRGQLSPAATAVLAARPSLAGVVAVLLLAFLGFRTWTLTRDHLQLTDEAESMEKLPHTSAKFAQISNIRL